MKRKKPTRKPTKKQQRDWNLVNDTMTTTIAAGVKTLQDKHGFSDERSGMWALETAILLNEHLNIDSSELHTMLGDLTSGQR